MNGLQYLSYFKVGKAIEGIERSKIDALSGIHQLKGRLVIKFERGIEEWDAEESYQLPRCLESVLIVKYPGRKISTIWSNHNCLISLKLDSCLKVKYLPPLRCLPHLKILMLFKLVELEYVEEENEADLFFPAFNIYLVHLLKLKEWGRSSKTMFPRVSTLYIEDCPVLESISRCPLVESINVDASSRVVQYLMSSFLEASAFTCLRHVDITSDDKLDIIHFSSSLPHLEHILIYECNQRKSFHVEDLPSLRVLKIAFCTRLKKLYVLNLNVLEELRIHGCDANLDLWGQQKASHVDWVSLTNLRLLIVDRFPKRIPKALEHLQTLSNLVIMQDIMSRKF